MSKLNLFRSRASAFRSRASTSHAVRVLGALIVLLSCTKAYAGGLFLLDRGARPLGRGGAFVAGADDPHSLWYNPAGLAESKNQVLADAVLTVAFMDFQRTDPSGNDIGPKVKATPTPLPIPTLAFSREAGDWVWGAGVFAPNTLLINWPRSVPGPGNTNDPSPSRYSLIGLRGSVLANLAGGLTYRGIKGLAIGAAAHVMLGRFKAETALSACDGFVCRHPEDPEYDAYATVSTIPTYGVTGLFGITWAAWDAWRWGASVMLPYTLRGVGSMNLHMPTAKIFEDAYLDGDKVKMAMKFPTIVRVGSEIRPVSYLRMEGAFVWEQWSRQKSIDIMAPQAFLKNVTGIGDYQVGNVKLQRNMNDMFSVRGGFELFIPSKWMIKKWNKLNLALRGGLAYEKSAFKSSTLTPMTIDANKVVIGGGLSFDLIPGWCRFDTTAGLVHMLNQNVRNSVITQPQAIRPNTTDVTALGNGNYTMEAFFLGGGFSIWMD
jgi:long-chain fatty acid transport protein